MDAGKNKTLIYPLASRLAHIAMIVGFGLAYLIVDFSLYMHAVLGVMFGVAIAGRILWGLFGTKYSKFSDFHFRGLFRYFSSFSSHKTAYISHNPASSIAIIIILALGVVCSLSGLMVYGIDEKSGVFANLYESYSKFSFVKDIHEISANLLLGVILVHICGALVDKLIAKNDSLNAIITGFKSTLNAGAIKPNLAQKLFCIIWIGAILTALSFSFYKQNPLLKSHYEMVDYAMQNPTFAKECGSCHFIYPPFLLTAKSWEIMMSDLENHFGDDASIDDESNSEILKYLVRNSADKTGTKISTKIAKTSKNEIAITQNAYWIKKHDKIPAKTFEQKSIKSKANCEACHKGIQNGIIQKDLIKFESVK